MAPDPKKRSCRSLLTASAVFLWILIWQVCASLANRNLLIPIPTPLSTASALVRLLSDQGFLRAVLFSVARIAAGFLCALAVGTLLAILCARFPLLETFTAPVRSLIRSIPVASFTILVFLWVSRERIPSTISFFTVLPIVWTTIEDGIRSADSGLIEMARVFGMSRTRILKEILLPGIRPFFHSATASGIGFAWKSGIAAEVICRTQDSLGNFLWAGKTSVDYDEVFAVTLVIVFLCTALARLTTGILRMAHMAEPERKGATTSTGIVGGTKAGDRDEGGFVAGIVNKAADDTLAGSAGDTMVGATVGTSGNVVSDTLSGSMSNTAVSAASGNTSGTVTDTAADTVSDPASDRKGGSSL